MRGDFCTSSLRFDGSGEFKEEGFYYISGFSNMKNLPVLPTRSEKYEGVVYANGFIEGLY